ncbi:MAG: RNA pyrophosphohydrolase, partial [Alphaproteobacteria bacterium]
SAWQMPQGGIDDGEEAAAAACRELNEETGVPPDLAEIVGQTGWIRYDLPEGLSQTAWQGRFRGQEQIWFAMRFLGEDKDVDLDADGHAAEFRTWRWVAPARLPGLVVSFKRGAYRRVLAELGRLVRPA